MYFFPVPTIPESVQRDIEILEDLFSVLGDRTFDILLNESISIEIFKARLSNLSVRNKKLHQEFLHVIFAEMGNASTLGDIWAKLNLYSNFLNYSLMEHLVKKFGDEKLITDFHEYKVLLKDFRSKTYLHEVTGYLKEINQSLSKKDLTRLKYQAKQMLERMYS